MKTLYCHRCKRDVIYQTKIGGKICPHCRIILKDLPRDIQLLKKHKELLDEEYEKIIKDL